MTLSRLRTWARKLLRGRPTQDERRRPGGRVRPRLEGLEDRLTPSAVSWTGSGDGVNWSDARNWSTGQLPGPADDVTIDSPGAVVIHASGSDSVHSLRSEDPVVLSGGALTLAADSAIDDTLMITGGTLSNAGPLAVEYLRLDGGTLTGAGDLSVAGDFHWAGGTLSGTGGTDLGGTSEISGDFFTELNGRTVDNHGVATLAPNTGFDFFFGGVWNNDADGTLVLQAGSSVGNFFANGAAVNNDGLVQKVGGGNAAVNVPLNDSAAGTVDVEGGTLTLTTGSGSGTFNAAAGAALTFSNAFTAGYLLQDGATGTGDGAIQVSTFNALTVNGAVSLSNLVVNGGTVTVADGGSLNTTTLALTGGTLTGPGDATVTGTFTWTNGTLGGTGRINLEGASSLSGGFFSALNGRSVINDGTATVAANSGITFEGNAVWTNDPGAALVLQAGSSLGNFFSNGSQLNNAGLLTVSAGGGSIGFAVTNTGTVTVGPGTSLNLAGNLTQTDGVTTVDGTLTVSNTVALNGGVLNGSGVINGNLVNAAEVDPGDSPGVLTINGNYTQTGAGTLVIEIGGPDAGRGYDRLAVNGTASLAGTLQVVILNGFTPDPGATFRVLTFRSHTGDFDTYAGLDLPDGRTLRAAFDPGDTGLTLTAPPLG